MSKRAAKLYLQDIVDSLTKIEKYSSNQIYEKFVNNDVTLDAVVRNFEIIGEAAKNVPPKIKHEYPDIPWREMTDFRNKVSHEYFGVEIKYVWKTIQEDVPGLAEKVQKVLNEQK